MVEVNKEQCKRIGKILGEVDIRPSFMDREFLNFDADRETKLRVYFISAAICQQTYNLVNKELNLFGWDYLEYGFLQMVRERNPMLHPGYLSICSNGDVKTNLQKTFSHDGNPENCTLDRLDERTSMLLEICDDLRKNHDGKVSNLMDNCHGKLLDNGNGLYEVLAKYSAFEDPLKKKITFFLKLATDAGVIFIKDPENAIPIMDYHMQRVLLRMGCAEILDEGLKEKILGREELESDTAVRKACIDAVRIISKESGHAIMKINDFFWSLGRSCCNETTLCNDGVCIKNPCTFDLMVEINAHTHCIFDPVCKGAADKIYRNLWEPIVKTHYY